MPFRKMPFGGCKSYLASVWLSLSLSRSSDLMGGGDMYTMCLSSGMPFNNTLIPEIWWWQQWESSPLLPEPPALVGKEMLQNECKNSEVKVLAKIFSSSDCMIEMNVFTLAKV